MKILDKENIGTYFSNPKFAKRFYEVKPGTIFQLGKGNVLLKTKPCFDHLGENGEKYNAILLPSGIPRNIREKELVIIRTNTEIVLKN